MSDCTGAPKGMCNMLKRVTLRGKDSLSWLEIDRSGDACLAIGECFGVSQRVWHPIDWCVSADLLSEWHISSNGSDRKCGKILTPLV